MGFLRDVFDTRKILDDKPANHIEFFSVISKPDMEPGYILLYINPIPIWKIPTRAFPVWMFYLTENVYVLKS